MVSFQNKIILLGGRDGSDQIKILKMPIEVFDTEKMAWSCSYDINIFRHSSFIIDRYTFIYGGCDYKNPLEGSENMLVFDVSYLITQINL
jgi:hypothetical protein